MVDFRRQTCKRHDVELLEERFLLKVFFQKREKFTIASINKAITEYKKLNWVICHSPYSVAFDGVEGKDYGHFHHELKISFLRTIGSVL